MFLFILVAVLLSSYLDAQSPSIKIDKVFIFSLFTRNSMFNTIKRGYADSLLSGDEMSQERELTIKLVYEERCVMECLQNMHCIRYTFATGQCQLRLHPKRRMIEDTETVMKMLELGIDYNLCADSPYCLSHADKKTMRTSMPLCNLFNTTGEKCQQRIRYELSKWSDWSACSMPCNDGFRKRHRSCLRKHTDLLTNKDVSTNVVLNKWLCANKDEEALPMEELETCNLGACKLYNEWTQWTACSRVCNGFRSRSRVCLSDKNNAFCNDYYLFENEPCSILDCNRGLLQFKSPNSSENDVKGSLGVYDTVTNRTMRIFTHTDDEEQIAKIAKVACSEYHLGNYTYATAKSVDTIKRQFNKTGYLDYINKQSLNGLKCVGNESRVLDCQIASNATLDTTIYEIEMECLLNGYWAFWDAWSECTVTCGAGARGRQRTCTNPEATKSNIRNGLECPGVMREMVVCFMVRCRV